MERKAFRGKEGGRLTYGVLLLKGMSSESIEIGLGGGPSETKEDGVMRGETRGKGKGSSSKGEVVRGKVLGTKFPKRHEKSR